MYYDQYDLLSHTSAVGVWLMQAIDWINDRFAGRRRAEQLLVDRVRQCAGPDSASLASSEEPVNGVVGVGLGSWDRRSRRRYVGLVDERAGQRLGGAGIEVSALEVVSTLGVDRSPRARI